MQNKVFSKENLPSEPTNWSEYRKKVLTKAVRIDGPFRVITSESENEPFYCEDGYLAIDPYAIAKEEFEKIYDLVSGNTKNA
jgi:hypothetical protein